MKSPREILLDRHRSAEPQLDAMRRRLVAGLSARRAGASPWSGFLELVWTQLIAPCRPVWTALAVVWVAIVLLQFNAARLRPPGSRDAAVVPSAPALAAAWAERRALGLENDAGVAASSRAADRIPGPRSDRAYPDFDRPRGASRRVSAVWTGVARIARTC